MKLVAAKDEVQKEPQVVSRSHWQIVGRRMRRYPLAIAGIVLLAFFSLVSLFAPVIAPYNPSAIDTTRLAEAPSEDHWLGTDRLGRDVLSRLIYAGRISLSVGLVAVSIYTTIGLILGSLAGTIGGALDNAIMRFADLLLCFPFLPMVIVVVYVVGPSIYNVMLVIGLLGWPSIARLVRAELLALREQDYAQAAVAIGSSTSRLAFRHLMPNALAPVVVAATFGVASAILTEAGLSFLGLGVQLPTPSWGNMLFEAQNLVAISRMPWLWIPPGIAIFISVLSINLIGDALRDALDPSLKE